jgi:hypothetical protein
MVSERRAFGERLKRHRERRGVSLETIANATKVPGSLYAGLERGDCARWPAGIYSRAYVRAYADTIGLNAADAAEEFSAIYGETPSAPPAAGVAVPKAGGRSHLRLSMAQEPAVDPERLARRAALAAAELVIGLLIASIALAGFGVNGWITVFCVVSYYVTGRLVSDLPLLFWVYMRMRSASTRPSRDEPQPENVPVGDAASTTA